MTAALVVGAAAAAVFSVMATTTLQELVPDEFLSRAAATFRVASVAGIPVGAAIAGVLGETTEDLRIGFAVAAASFVALGGLRLLLPDLKPSHR